MNPRNQAVQSIFSIFKDELLKALNLQLIMDANDYNGFDSLCSIANGSTPEQPIMSEEGKKIFRIKIANSSGTSFSSMGKDVTGFSVMINDVEYAKINKHFIEQFDYMYDVLEIEGDLTTIFSTYDIRSVRVQKQDSIFMYVESGTMPKMHAFNRNNNKAHLMLFNFAIVAKEDGDKWKIEEYTDTFYNIFYCKYRRSFPIFENPELMDNVIAHTVGTYSEMITKDFLSQGDNAMVRIITIPAIININYNKK